MYMRCLLIYFSNCYGPTLKRILGHCEYHILNRRSILIFQLVELLYLTQFLLLQNRPRNKAKAEWYWSLSKAFLKGAAAARKNIAFNLRYGRQTLFVFYDSDLQGQV